MESLGKWFFFFAIFLVSVQVCDAIIVGYRLLSLLNPLSLTLTWLGFFLISNQKDHRQQQQQQNESTETISMMLWSLFLVENEVNQFSHRIHQPNSIVMHPTLPDTHTHTLMHKISCHLSLSLQFYLPFIFTVISDWLCVSQCAHDESSTFRFLSIPSFHLLGFCVCVCFDTGFRYG